MVRCRVLLLLSVCTSDVVSYRPVRPLGWLCDSSGVSAPAPASASASARMRSLLAAQCRELPGVKQKDIEIEYPDPHTMQIKGHTEHSSEEKDGSWWVSERSMGDFRRSFSFPSPVDRDATHAHLRDGILTVTVPKTMKQEETKKITIEE